MKTRMLSLLVLALFTPQNVSAGGPAKATPWIMTGVVRNAAGQPLEGVDVSARNTVYYNMNVVARTDRQGRYRIALPREVGTWAPYATIRRPWGDQVFQFTVYPGSAAPFAARDGAIRDFIWRIQGPHDGGVLGQKVNVYFGGGEVDASSCVLTYTPVGPLIDGSAGKAFQRGCESLKDVPVGRYRITGTHAPGGVRQALEVRAEGQDVYAAATTGTFRETTYGIRMEVTYRAPGL